MHVNMCQKKVLNVFGLNHGFKIIKKVGEVSFKNEAYPGVE